MKPCHRLRQLWQTLKNLSQYTRHDHEWSLRFLILMIEVEEGNRRPRTSRAAKKIVDDQRAWQDSKKQPAEPKKHPKKQQTQKETTQNPVCHCTTARCEVKDRFSRLCTRLYAIASHRCSSSEIVVEYPACECASMLISNPRSWYDARRRHLPRGFLSDSAQQHKSGWSFLR